MKKLRDVTETHSFYFPLYAIRFSNDPKMLAEHLISYCTVEYSYYLMDKFEYGIGDFERICRDVEQNAIKNFEFDKDEHIYLLQASIKQGIIFNDIKELQYEHNKLKIFIQDYEAIYGVDAKVKMHRDLIFETRDGNLPF